MNLLNIKMDLIRLMETQVQITNKDYWNPTELYDMILYEVIVCLFVYSRFLSWMFAHFYPSRFSTVFTCRCVQNNSSMKSEWSSKFSNFNSHWENCTVWSNHEKRFCRKGRKKFVLYLLDYIHSKGICFGHEATWPLQVFWCIQTGPSSLVCGKQAWHHSVRSPNLMMLAPPWFTARIPCLESSHTLFMTPTPKGRWLQ